MELTLANYYSKENTAISNSKVSDFLASREFYKAKHIDGTVEEKLSRSMLLGKLVDHIFSTGHDLDEAKEEEFGLIKGITPALLATAREMGRQLINADFYHFYQPVKGEKEVFFQTPLFGEIGTKKKRIGICGLPDVYSLDHGTEEGERSTIYIDDLKTSNPSAMRSSATWYWHCLSYGYFRQMFCYQFLLRRKYPGAKIVMRHIVIGSKADRGKYPIKLFEIPSKLVIPHGKTFLETVKAIRREKTWKDDPVSWSQIEYMTSPTEKVEFVTDSED